jgi:methylmalonyl-CoA carboxyltransferase large subunit
MPEKKSQSGVSVEGLQQALDALAAQLAALTARLEKLEAVGSAAPAVAAAPVVEALAQPVVEPVAAQPPVAEAAAAEPAPEPVKAVDEFSEELLLVLSAAVAAYLGKRPHIRAVRLIGSSAWAQQGRVFVQASHQLNVPHEA